MTSSLIVNLVSRIEKELDCISHPYPRWHSFHVKVPKTSQTRFGVLTQSGETTTICFRVNPNKFLDDSTQVKNVSGFFFPTGTERRIYVTRENTEEILKFLKQAQDFTKELLLGTRNTKV